MTGKPQTKKACDEAFALERMNKALKAALETPPQPHKEKPKTKKASAKKPAK